jgi:hypothetical protein
VPKLKLMDGADLCQCLASYIEEGLEDWDLKIAQIEVKKEGKK